MNLHNKTVLFIDLDNTLIKTISGKTFPEDITDFRIQLPVLDKIIEKLPNLEYFLQLPTKAVQVHLSVEMNLRLNYIVQNTFVVTI